MPAPNDAPHDRTSDRTRLLRYLDGELPADAAQRLERRLEAEPALRAQLNRLARLTHTLQAEAPRTFDDGFARRVMNRLPDRAPEAESAPAATLYDALQPAFVRLALASGIAIAVLGGLNAVQYQDAGAGSSVVEAALGLPDASLDPALDPAFDPAFDPVFDPAFDDAFEVRPRGADDADDADV